MTREFRLGQGRAAADEDTYVVKRHVKGELIASWPEIARLPQKVRNESCNDERKGICTYQGTAQEPLCFTISERWYQIPQPFAIRTSKD